MAREFDIVLFGAAGFIGCIIAEYLAERAATEGIEWAIADINAEGLEKLTRELGDKGPAAHFVADAMDADSMAALAERTRVVLTCAGPYGRLGRHMVAACAAAGTDYVDLAGEATFVRDMIDAHAETAAGSGARLVHSCGVDSMPSDLGVHYLQSIAIDKTGGPVARVKGRVEDFQGALSGGTLASMHGEIERAQTDPRMANVLTNALSLTPAGTGPEQPDQDTPTYDEELGTWATAFMMASINRQIVHRTNALLDFRHHRELRYDEMFATGPGDEGKQKAIDLRPSGGIPVDETPPVPGEGPSREVREAGSFRFVFSAPESPDVPAVAVISDMDPGYGTTSKMCVEAAITLLRDTADLAGGSWTPASAMADALRARLIDQGVLEFKIRG